MSHLLLSGSSVEGGVARTSRPGGSAAGAVLIEVVLVLAVVSILAITIWALFTTVTSTTTYSLKGSWAPGSCPPPPNTPAVRSTPYPVSYNLSTITATTTTTTTPPFGAPATVTTTTAVPLPAAGASVTFSLVGKGGAVFVTGGRQYTVSVTPTGKADIRLVAVNGASDEVAAAVNVAGGIYPDTQTCLVETQP